MKNSLLLIITLSVILFNASCNRKAETKSCCKTNEEVETKEIAGPISDESVYLLDSEWESYHGQTKHLADFKGEIVVASMFFSNCPSACPRIAADMKAIEAKLTLAERAKVQFVLISMDPERDNPEQLQAFATNHQLNSRWELMRSGKNATMEIANVLGVKIKPLEEGGFDHSNIIHILNQQGEIVYQQMGLNVDPEMSLKEIRELM